MSFYSLCQVSDQQQAAMNDFVAGMDLMVGAIVSRSSPSVLKNSSVKWAVWFSFSLAVPLSFWRSWSLYRSVFVLVPSFHSPSLVSSFSFSKLFHSCCLSFPIFPFSTPSPNTTHKHSPCEQRAIVVAYPVTPFPILPLDVDFDNSRRVAISTFLHLGRVRD